MDYVLTSIGALILVTSIGALILTASVGALILVATVVKNYFEERERRKANDGK